ncbi:lipid II:glycine glycyltransferase FemX [Rhodococcus gannanensis]|uniref:Lipid II:glycine glycyltransferase FemX n=1 Tax=Rhodococcus gannanensis TaxID=1960308 RepID=A0ABW4P8V0_9NOCA
MVKRKPGKTSPPSGTHTDARLAHPHEIEQWDDHVARNPDGGHPFRGRAFAESLRLRGYDPDYLFVDDLAITAARVRVPKIGTYWQIPGPGVTDVDELCRVVDALIPLADANGVFTIRIDPLVEDDQATRTRLLDLGYRRTLTWTIDHSIVLDVTGTEAEVQGRFSTRARRWIKRAARDGVVVSRVDATEENCRLKYDLLSATSEARFAIPSRPAATATYQQAQSAGTGQLFFAHFEGTLVAAGYAMALGENSLYLTGASVRKEAGSSAGNGLGAHGVGHAVQWEMIRWAREVGCLRYDMYGAPSSGRVDDPGHPLYGVGQFKLSFSKAVTDYIGCWDVPVGGTRSRLFYEAERATVRLNRFGIVSRFTGHNAQNNPDLDWFG